ncbi:transposase [Streptomyces sp. 891-h]|nr:transposase [Streptomyces sp. 891-h]
MPNTQGQNFPVFALAHLLGFDLMPRIRNWKELTFYRPSKQSEYVHIDALFGEPGKHVIDFDLIESQCRHLDARGRLRTRGHHLLLHTAQAPALGVEEERHLRRLPRGRPRDPQRPTPALPLGRAASPAGDRGDQQGRVVQPVLAVDRLRQPRRHCRRRPDRAGEGDEVQRPAHERGDLPQRPGHCGNRPPAAGRGMGDRPGRPGAHLAVSDRAHQPVRRVQHPRTRVSMPTE